jgi:hypothetical protein
MAALKRQGQFELAFVVFPDAGNPFDEESSRAPSAARAFPMSTLQGCLKGQPDADGCSRSCTRTSSANVLLATDDLVR